MTKSIALLITIAASAALAPSAAGQSAPAAAALSVTPPAAAPGAAAAAANSPWTDREYRLGPGDKLRVEVYGETQLSQSLQVRPDGRITLPLINELAAAGRTPVELRDSIAASLTEYLRKTPVVTVIVQEAIAAQIYVIGEVATPGAQVLTGPLSVLQALATAGGLTAFADKGDIRVLRKDAAGRTQAISFDYKQAVKGKLEPVFLQPGDTLVVP